jgi:mevalonate kinase
LDDLITSRVTLAKSLQDQEETNQRRHVESQEFIESQHTETRTGVIVAVNGAAASTGTHFQLMRKEIEIVGDSVARNQQDISRILEEVNRLAQAMARAQTDKQRKKLQERRNFATETLYALISAYKTLTVRK